MQARLVEIGGRIKCYEKDQIIFHEGDIPRYFFFLVQGKVKMNNYGDNGKEFIQGIFYALQSFGEPPLLGGFDYPANAVAMELSEILRVPKQAFFSLLDSDVVVASDLVRLFAKRLQYKATMAAEISNQSPGHRILTLIDFIKDQECDISEKWNYPVNFTRQQIADLTGLRVETVIRTIKELERQGAVKVLNRKVWR